VDKSTGVQSDHTVILTTIRSIKAYPETLLSGYKSNRISCLVFSGRSVRERPS